MQMPSQALPTPVIVRARLRGFTLIEMLVVLLIIGLVVAYFGHSVMGSSEDTKLNVARTQVLTALPSALISYYNANGYEGPVLLGASNPTRELVRRGVNPDSPWGNAWSIVSENAGSDQKIVKILYPLGGDKTQAKRNIGQVISSMTSGPPLGSSQWHGPAAVPMVERIQEQPNQLGLIVTYNLN